MLKKEFGAAGDEIVIEEFLEGEELSFFTFSDGSTLRTLPPAQVRIRRPAPSFVLFLKAQEDY